MSHNAALAALVTQSVTNEIAKPKVSYGYTVPSTPVVVLGGNQTATPDPA